MKALAVDKSPLHSKSPQGGGGANRRRKRSSSKICGRSALHVDKLRCRKTCPSRERGRAGIILWTFSVCDTDQLRQRQPVPRMRSASTRADRDGIRHGNAKR